MISNLQFYSIYNSISLTLLIEYEGRIKIFSDTQKISKIYLLFTLFDNPLNDELQENRRVNQERRHGIQEMGGWHTGESQRNPQQWWREVLDASCA